jgi:hypothetical protein
MIKLPEFLENLLAINFVDVAMAVHFVQFVALSMKAVVQHNQFRLWLFHCSLIERLYIELMRHHALGKIWQPRGEKALSSCVAGWIPPKHIAPTFELNQEHSQTGE